MAHFELFRVFCNKSCIRGVLMLVVSPTEKYTICQTLEPAPNCLLFSNVDGSKCYPAVESGTYNLSVTYSPKFRCNLPLLSVPGREGIRIHVGNTSSDSTGCILVGLYGDKISLFHSRITLRFVLDVIKACKITSITIVNNDKLF